MLPPRPFLAGIQTNSIDVLAAAYANELELAFNALDILPSHSDVVVFGSAILALPTCNQLK
jgi:hypothetical protein